MSQRIAQPVSRNEIPGPSRGCHQPVTRRNVLQAAAGLGLSFALPGLEPRAAERRGPERARSLILVWLGGGPSQLETWDPHPGTKIGGPTKSIGTRIPGLEICDLFPQVAEQIDAVSVIRSLVSKEGDHERGAYVLKTGYRPDVTVKHPSLGAILTHRRPQPELEIPSHISLASSRWPGRGGYLGDGFDAFRVPNPGINIRNMRPTVASTERQERRLSNLDVLSRGFGRRRGFQVEPTRHAETIADALRMMSSEQLKAFDLTDEPEPLKAAYGDSPFGRGCLVARRLVEQGVRSIEVSLEGFDTHADNFTGHETQAKILDPALATLLHDLKQRDLLDSTMVLCVGEFGRTPNINPLDGRDHWPGGFSCLIGGGGLRAGEVIGATDPAGLAKEPEDPVQVGELFATVLAAFGVDWTEELIVPKIGRPLALTDSGQPLARLLPG